MSENLAYYFDTAGGDVGAIGDYGYDPYSDTGWFGSAVFKKIGNTVKSIGKAAAKVGNVVAPVVKQALPVVQMALKNMGPIGMAASGALSGAEAVLSGKNVKDIALSMAIGAAPMGIDRALQIGTRIAKGDNLIKLGLEEAGKSFVPGSQGAVAFDVAKKLLSKGSPKEALAAARKNLANETQRRAFDAAVGSAARIGDKMNVPRQNQLLAAAKSRANILAGNRGPKPLNIMPPKKRIQLPAVFPPQVAIAAQAAARNGLSPVEAARRMGAPVGQVRRALGSNFMPRMSWRPLSPAASNFVMRHVPHAPMSALRVVSGRDTTGLVDGGKVYVVENGDFPGKIATKLTGKGSNWPQLIAANPQKKTKTTSIGKEFVTLFAGERLNVPASWQKAITPDPIVAVTPAKPSTTTTLPEVVIAVDKSNTSTAAILQAKGLLVTWSKTDGLGEAGFTDYGVKPEDMSTTFGARDKFVAMSFEKWSNRVRGTKLDADGEMNAELSDGLRAWAEARSSLPVPAAPASPIPVLAPAPPVAAPLPLPPSPVLPPVSPVTASPVVPQPSPVVAPPVVSPFPPVAGPSTPAPSVPPVLPVFAPAPPVSAPVVTAPGAPVAEKKKEGDIFLPAALGAAGWFLFGPIGGIVGAGAGMAATQA